MSKSQKSKADIDLIQKFSQTDANKKSFPLTVDHIKSWSQKKFDTKLESAVLRRREKRREKEDADDENTAKNQTKLEAELGTITQTITGIGADFTWPEGSGGDALFAVINESGSAPPFDLNSDQFPECGSSSVDDNYASFIPDYNQGAADTRFTPTIAKLSDNIKCMDMARYACGLCIHQYPI